MDQLLKEVVDLTKQMKVKILVCENKLEKSFWHTNLRYKPRSNVTVAESNLMLSSNFVLYAKKRERNSVIVAGILYT